jgi:hypothetical protein
MGMHALEKLLGDGVSGCGTDDGINFAFGAKGCLFLIDPLADARGRKAFHAVEASACFALIQFGPMITAMIVGDHVIFVSSKPSKSRQ